MKKSFATLSTLFLVIVLTACSAGTTETVSSVTSVQNSNTTTEVTTVTSTGAETVSAALAENSEVHEDAQDYEWDSSSVVSITLNGDSISIEGTGVAVDGSVATIFSTGTYSLSGSLSDGQVIVNTEGDGIVRLILNGVDINCTTSAPIYIVQADETVIILAENTTNTITDGASYVLADATVNEPNAAIFSMSDLTIYGDGALDVTGNYADGIASKDGLLITSGTITVNAVDDGIRGKDYLVVQDGNITIQAQGNGMLSDNEEDATKGFISIEAGVINITAGGDAISAQTDVMVASGELSLNAGGGSSARTGETTSAKGIKGLVSVNIDGGTFIIDTADDAIHSNGSLVVNGGSFVIATGDDGLHSDATLEINGGEIQITGSYEGIESAVITINAGTIHVLSSDDGINVAGGVDGSGTPGGMPTRGGGPGQDMFSYSGSYYLYINGGYISVEARGDGLDINGAIEMTDGVVLVNGPVENMNGALDYDGTFNISGGFFVAVGSAGMAMAPSQSSSQASILVNFTSAQRAGTLISIQDSAGNAILTFAPTKEYQSIAFSSPDLVNGATYNIYLGGDANGTVVDSLLQDGTYSGGSQYTSLTLSGMVTSVGGGGMGGGGRPRP